MGGLASFLQAFGTEADWVRCAEHQTRSWVRIFNLPRFFVLRTRMRAGFVFASLRRPRGLGSLRKMIHSPFSFRKRRLFFAFSRVSARKREEVGAGLDTLRLVARPISPPICDICDTL